MLDAAPDAVVPVRIGESGYVRREHDAYWTEPRVTDALVAKVALRPRVWEPACGRGDISERLKIWGHKVFSSDLHDHGYGERPRDFLTEPSVAPETSIVTNPPYTLAAEFIEHALMLTRPIGGQVAILVEHQFPTAAGRRHLFEHPAFAQLLILTFRPRWDWWETDKPKASPRKNFVWCVWDWRHIGPAVVRFAP